MNLGTFPVLIPKAKTLTNQGVIWQFISKRAPWFGGFWDRLIKLTTKSFKKIFGRSFVTLCELQSKVVVIPFLTHRTGINSTTTTTEMIQNEEDKTTYKLLFCNVFGLVGDRNI